MSNARNLANLLGTGSTIVTAKIADDAITAAKIDDDGTGFTFGDLTTGALTATGATTGIVTFDKLKLDGSSVATVTVNSAVSSSATIVVDGVSGTIAVGMVVNVSDISVRSISDSASQTAISTDDSLTITAVASQTSFTVSEAVSIADNVVLILTADENQGFVLDASAASTDVGEEILFEDATDDVSILFKDGFNAAGVIQASGSSHYSAAAVTTSSGTYTGTGAFNSIIPTSVHSKILVICSVPFYKNVSAHQGNMNIFRGNASIAAGGSLTSSHIGIVSTTKGFGSIYSQAHDHMATCSCALLDQPNLAGEEIFYNICMMTDGGAIVFGDYDFSTTLTLLEIL